jgi:poly(A) polymerase/tRNA nucleotidyltransferase (CCA-adding enzyme)
MSKIILPQPVEDVLTVLEAASFEAFVVGGSVRDLLLGKTPRDWDITTNALPEQIQGLFPDSFYENTFGTVGVKVPRFLATTPENKEEDVIEVTTYRSETIYTDSRRPDAIQFETVLERDLARRDFTINALAYGRRSGVWQIIDLFDGQKDLAEKVLRAVGTPEERFSEDALRLMRAVRLVTELRTPIDTDFFSHDWIIAKDTADALGILASNLERIAKERIQEEFNKIILSGSPAYGIQLLQDTNLLSYIIPELQEGLGVEQNLHHIYSVWEHNLRALATCPSPKLTVRLACLLHDVGKPRTKHGNGTHATFYNHDHVGARMTKKILERLKYSRALIEAVTLLVDQHMFFYNVGEVSEAAVRRLVKRVGVENMDDLLDVRVGDRLGSGVPKAVPYKMRHLKFMIDKVSKDPLSVKMLAVSGTDLMSELCLKPGPAVGTLLDILLAEVIDDPARNTRKYLLGRARELEAQSLEELRILARAKAAEENEKEIGKIKKKHWVE